MPITRASAQMWSWAFVEPPVAATWRRPFLRLASVTMSEKRTPSFVSVTMRSPTLRACLYLADEQKSMVVLSMGHRPMTSANTPMVLAVPYMRAGAAGDGRCSHWKRGEGLLGLMAPTPALADGLLQVRA